MDDLNKRSSDYELKQISFLERKLQILPINEQRSYMQGYFDCLKQSNCSETLKSPGYSLLYNSSTPTKLTKYLLKTAEMLKLDKERSELLEGIEIGKRFLKSVESLHEGLENLHQ